MDQAVSTYATDAKISHRAALRRAREAIERRGGEWYAVYVLPGGLLSGRTTSELIELTKHANAGEREGNMADPRIRAWAEAANRRAVRTPGDANRHHEV